MGEGETCWRILSSSSFLGPYSHRWLGEIVKLSTFGNNDRRTSNVPWVREISCNSRVVIEVQGNLAKHRRTVCSPRSRRLQERRARVCGSDRSKQSKAVDGSVASLGDVK
jgi:hypothetical protein